jgi:23S rRNA pseudouridine955/2504/2580 synthase
MGDRFAIMTKSQPTIVTDDEDGVRLDRWIKLYYPGVAFGQLQKLLRSGQIRVNGGRAKSSTRLAAGQQLRLPPSLLTRPVEKTETPNDENGDVAYFQSLVIYEDKDLYVINKPAGLAVQGGSGLTRHVDGILESLRDRKGVKPRLVHRLDRATSGCLMIAKNRSMAAALGELLKARQTRKVYWALAYELPRPANGRISCYLKREQRDDADLMVKAKHGEKGAQHAVTEYQVLENSAGRLSWLALSPLTGRTHQLRVHLQSIGHPIVGDAWYFDVENWQLPGGLQNKLHLHARSLVFTHPKSGTLVDISAPLSPHMHQAWRVLGFDPDHAPDIPHTDPFDDTPGWWVE